MIHFGKCIKYQYRDEPSISISITIQYRSIIPNTGMTLCLSRAVSSTAVYRLCVSVNSMYHDRHRQHSVVSPGGRHHISTSTQEMR